MSWGVYSEIESTFYYITLNHSCLVRVSFTYVHARITCVQARMYHDASQCVQNGCTQAATKLQLSCNQAATKLQPSCNQAATKLHAKCNVASSMHHRCMHIACAVDATVMHRPWTVHASSTVCSYIKAVLYLHTIVWTPGPASLKLWRLQWSPYKFKTHRSCKIDDSHVRL